MTGKEVIVGEGHREAVTTGWPMKELDPGNQRLLTSSPVLGMCVLHTVLMVGSRFKGCSFEHLM